MPVVTETPALGNADISVTHLSPMLAEAHPCGKRGRYHAESLPGCIKGSIQTDAYFQVLTGTILPFQTKKGGERKLREIVVSFDGPDSDKVHRRQARNCMTVVCSEESTATGKSSAE